MTHTGAATYAPRDVVGAFFLVFLSITALVGAAALGSLLWTDSRAERALAIAALWLALVLGPIHVLGWLSVVGLPHALDRANLAVSIVALSCAALATGLGHLAPRAGARRTLDALRDVVMLPLDALRACIEARSLATVGLLAVVAVVLWTAWGAWLAPSSAWDGVFYHEAMIGFAIQNGGFELGDLPPGLAPIAGYPRMAESLSLFFVMFLDRRLIELPGSPMLLVILLGAYTIMRRFVPSRATAIGLASGLALLPGIVLQLRSTYIDTVACAFFVVALHFATRSPLRPRDAVLAGFAIGLVGASKSTGFLLAPVMAAVLLPRIAFQIRGLGRAALSGLAVVALIGAITLPTYARNWLEHENPVWPGRVHYPSIGIDWDGPLDVASHQRSFGDTVTLLFDPPIAGQQYHDTRDNGYGNAPPFVVLPLAFFAILIALFGVLRDRALGVPRARRSAAEMLVIVLPILATLVLSPAHYWARLNLHSVVAIWIAAAWLIGRSRRALGEGVVGALVVGGIVTLMWSDPAWDIPLARVRRLAGLAAEERAISADGIITLMPDDIARERERMGPHDVVVFSEHPFPAQLWNERFTNRVLWLAPSERDWLERAEAMGATWVVVPSFGSLISRLRDREDWEEIGPAVREREVTAFRRIAVPAAP